MNDNYLEHYGVKGMHWGVRRYQNYDGTRIGGPIVNAVKKNKHIHEIRPSRGIRTLSNLSRKGNDFFSKPLRKPSEIKAKDRQKRYEKGEKGYTKDRAQRAKNEAELLRKILVDPGPDALNLIADGMEFVEDLLYSGGKHKSW